MAEPPAESPSTINNSEISGSFEVLSANFPGKLEISKPFFLRVTSRALLAAIRALAAKSPFSTICFATVGFSSINLLKVSLNNLSVTFRASEFPNLVFVCPSNCGLGCLIDTTAVKPSRTSSPERFASFSLIKPLLRP